MKALVWVRAQIKSSTKINNDLWNCFVETINSYKIDGDCHFTPTGYVLLHERGLMRKSESLRICIKRDEGTIKKEKKDLSDEVCGWKYHI